MTKASDVAKKKQQLAKQLKNVCNKTGKPREKDIVAVVRGAVRKAWMRSPTKLSLLAKSAIHVSDIPKERLPKGLTKVSKWLYECSMCKDYFIPSKIQCDHIGGENSLKTYDDMLRFTRSILDVGWEDLQLLCVECHSYKTYSERYNVSIEQAKREKEVIAIINGGVAKQKSFIKKHEVTPATTIVKRRDQIRAIIKGDV